MTEKTKLDKMQPQLSRRDLLKSSAALAATAAVSACSGGGGSSSSANKPNILFILVDEMRYPKVLPEGVTDAADYLRQYMPNLYRLWISGVKFANHNTAATACSPSRGVLVTGLYSHQTWFGTTLVVVPGASHADSPSLQPEFPTYGKILRDAGYITPYVGKWHLSQSSTGSQDISAYGFQGLTYPDPIGNNLQGTYGDITTSSYMYWNDEYIATQASTWLSNKQAGDQPWCLTVGFQNPHDQEFFPAGTEFQTFTDMFVGSAYSQKQNWTTSVCATGVTWATNVLRYPPQIYNIATPPNWQTLSAIYQTKPKAQTLNRQFCEVEWGGISESVSQTSFTVVGPYPLPATAYSGYTAPTVNGKPIATGVAPYSYWQKALNLYTQLLGILDVQIGRVLDALPAEVARNTMVVFTSDHGDYVGAHGMVAGKTFTMYDEALRVPLIVKDPTGTFTGDLDVIRTQLTSSVDMMPMLVGLGYGGNKSAWMQGDYAEMYGNRYDMFPILKSANAAGLDYALFATDEVAAFNDDFVTAPHGPTNQRTPVHIMGVITPQYKLGVYSCWPTGTTDPTVLDQQYEYYDYSTVGGQQETDNTYSTTPGAVLIKDRLLNVLVPTVLEKPLPAAYLQAQLTAKTELEAFNAVGQASGRE